MSNRSSRLLWLAGGGLAGFATAVAWGHSGALTQPVATAAAGAGALAAGVLAYVNGQRSREQAERHHREEVDRERERHAADTRQARESALRDRYVTVASQLADPSPAIRQAGVYAAVALADDWHAFGENQERQVCVDLLRSYLKVRPEQKGVPDASHLPPTMSTGEMEVRATIVRVVAERRQLRGEELKSWADVHTELGHAELAGLSLGPTLTAMRMPHANLNYAGMADADLRGANLSSARLCRATLVGADLCKANLDRADLTAALLRGADLVAASMAVAVVDEAIVTQADLREANLFASSLKHADLREADLSDTNLNFTNLTGADLRGANLWGANLSGANLEEAQLRNAILTEVKFDDNTRWPDGFTP
ncbi:pentapeptide repeat-containing protein [Nocardia abscessus]|uniref:pentapeptide repeat-containing protein n=1 Tax=Nocardia abscessus TaxID=120957 RepID=UPI002455DE6D|nr:pentapeptide repeat-containing protein [Nocardia abscessus]